MLGMILQSGLGWEFFLPITNCMTHTLSMDRGNHAFLRVSPVLDEVI